MKPFLYRNQTDEQRVFSYRLSRARRIVENAFGIMSSRFRVLKTTIGLSPDNTEKVALSCCVLHNLFRQDSNNEYNIAGSTDREIEEMGTVNPGSWRNETPLIPLLPSRSRNPSTESRQVREQFCAYFNNEGSVPWQRRMIGLEDQPELSS